MAVPNWPYHAQSIDRRVKQVTDACDRVFPMKSETGALEIRNQLMSKNSSKQDLVKFFSFQND